MLFASPLTPLSPLRQVIADAYTADETDCVESLLRGLALDTDARVRIASRARASAPAGHARGLSAGIRPLLARGRGVDVPRRGPAAHPRRRHGRPLDPRQARQGRLG